MLDRGVWLNEPTRWSRHGDGLSVTTDRASDFWRETLYGFTRDNGHFLGVPTAGEFTAQVRVRADYDQLYDQAGLMVRLDEQHWVKTGVEFTDGARMLSTVVTGPALRLVGQRARRRSARPVPAGDRGQGCLADPGFARRAILAAFAAGPVPRGRSLSGRADVLHAGAGRPRGRVLRVHRLGADHQRPARPDMSGWQHG